MKRKRAKRTTTIPIPTEFGPLTIAGVKVPGVVIVPSRRFARVPVKLEVRCK